MSTFRVAGILSLDGSRFAAGLSRAEIAASRFASRVATSLAAAFSVGALTMYARKVVEASDGFVIAAKRMGATVEQVQILKQAGKDANVELESMVDTFDRISAAQAKALGGGAKGDLLKARFAKAGITEAQLRMPTSQLVHGPLAAYARSANQQDAVALLRPILGGAGGAFIEVLRSDFEGIGNELKSLGGLMSTETAVSLKVLKDNAETAAAVLLAKFANELPSAINTFLDGISAYLGYIDRQLGIEKTEKEAESGPGFWSKSWHGALGVGSGLLGLWDQVGATVGIPGTKERADQRVESANAHFAKSFGFMSGGVLQGLAQEAVTQMNKGGSLQGAFEAKRADIAGQIKKEVDKINNPPPSTGESVIPAAKKTAVSKIGSDSLVAVGNFLGAGAGASMQRIAMQQLDVQRRMLDKLTEIAEGDDADEGFGGND